MSDPAQPAMAAAQHRVAAVVVMAAGSGTRMRSRTAKVMHRLGGRSMLGHVLAAAEQLRPDRVVVVVGHGREQVEPHVRELWPDAVLAVQRTQAGTADAVRTGLAALADDPPEGTVLVLSGDTPLLEARTLASLVAARAAAGQGVTVLTGVVADPTGYGRVLRGPGGGLAAIVEQQDATAAQREVREVNSGIYAFDAGFLRRALERVEPHNAAGELYLTDAVAIAVADGVGAGAHLVDDVAQTSGANDQVQLAGLAAVLNQRVLDRWMRAGVRVEDPATTWVDVTVSLAPDVTVHPGVQLLGATTVAEGAEIGPDTTLRDVEVGPAAVVVRCHGWGAVVGAGAMVGPFSFLRPGTRLGPDSKVGGFVEVKNAVLHDGAKVPHLSYVGDAEIGAHANIGAGTIVANYDGVAKHRTVVGAHARTGANNSFVAPVVIGEGAATGAGTVVRREVPPGALALSAGEQRNLEGWVLRRRPGTPSADAARAAGAAGAAED